jgi:hypothetical protein
MRNIMTSLRAAALIAGACIPIAAGFAAAQESTVLVPSAAGTTVQPTTPAPGQAATPPRPQIVIDESLSAPHSELPAGATVVRNPACIKYDTDRSARRMYACSGSFNVIMVACNPANGCLYEIPLCIPGCCAGEPTVSNRRGLFGRGIVEYCWPCGFSAEVKFRNIGDIKVDYDG